MRRGIALVAAFGAALACSVVTSYDGFTGEKCTGKIPDRPTSPGGDDGKMYFGALSSLSFFDKEAKEVKGYDLDDLCTCHPDPAACHGPPGSDQCDPEGTGIDNKAGQALSGIFRGTDAGGAPPGYGVAVRLSGYNGGANDNAVHVEIYNVVKVTGSDGSPPTTSNGPYQVTVAKDDVNLETNMSAVTNTDDAYVTDGRLVAKFPAFNLRVKATNPFGDEAVVDTPLSAVKLIGKIKTTKDGGLSMSDAMLVGRMLQTPLFDALSHYGLCRDAAAPVEAGAARAGGFGVAKQQLCAVLDLPEGDPNPSAPCVAMSIAILITLSAGQLAPKSAPAIPITEICGKEPPFSCN